MISLSLYPFSLSKRPTCYKVRAGVSRAFTARNPISMKRQSKRLRRETNIAFQDDTPPCGYVRVVCVNSSGLSDYSRENLTVLSQKQESKPLPEFRLSSCILIFFQTDHRKNQYFRKELKNFRELICYNKIKVIKLTSEIKSIQ